MPRTIDANLTAALTAGTGVPYLLGFIGYADGSILYSEPVLSYKLTATALEFETANTQTIGGDQVCIWLERGVTVAGVKYSVTTGRFYLQEQTYSPGRMVAKGSLFPRQYYAAAGYDTYSNIITAFCAAYGKTAVFRNPADAWLAYKFFPTGKSIILNDANAFLPLLAQKYLIYACDMGAEQVLFYTCAGSLAGAADETITASNQLTKNYNLIRARQFMWRDEAGTVHNTGTATDPIHNLGYLESTAAAPARTKSAQLAQAIIRPDLRILDGDIVALSALGSSMKVFAIVTEEYALPSSGHGTPRWQMTVAANDIFANTAGGAMPSTIERVSNYTPLNTSMFNGILSTKDNNLQAAMDRIDDHAHTIYLHGAGATIPAASTLSLTPGISGLNAGTYNNIAAKTGLLRNLRVRTNTVQPVGGSMVVTLQIANVDTLLSVTIPAGSANGDFADTGHIVAINAGDAFHIALKNNAPATASAGVTACSFQLDS